VKGYFGINNNQRVGFEGALCDLSPTVAERTRHFLGEVSLSISENVSAPSEAGIKLTINLTSALLT
jgi:hypothetical protein